MTASAEPSRTEVTKQRILESATKAFAERGFHGTSTRDITTAAGTSSAALYVHHKSKEELLFLISKAGHETTLALMLEGRGSSGDPAEQLHTVVRDFIADHARNHTRARIVNYEMAALDPEHLEEITALRHRIDVELIDLIAAGIKAGTFDIPDPRIAASAILSLGIDLARWFSDDFRLSPEELGEEYAELALRIVRARGH
ncbi:MULTISPECIES: TetR family transcriptional regulator [unclassified Nocardioides]|uniref:TetR family transcriptional regulator n=1 Tax=unclassified Nocardioides TaxID=2615069 RepID=UPI000702DA36|nr:MULTISPECIES: TetR family transcriptional regulator [unclassified Nocardioides]KRC54729.1 TetR family transcriptional regulator [Nocardioides sp. Root79]KRC73926.1 TetR family transcriptional regulator [Nocardioides sp. Root240]